jgi:hypothetical protein
MHGRASAHAPLADIGHLLAAADHGKPVGTGNKRSPRRAPGIGPAGDRRPLASGPDGARGESRAF